MSFIGVKKHVRMIHAAIEKSLMIAEEAVNWNRQK
jgi:hypothetical protein